MRYIWLVIPLVLTGHQVLAQDEDPPLVRHVQSGEYYASQGNIARAIEEYELALKAGAGSAQVLNRLAQLYLQAGSLEKAIAMLHNSLKERPGQLAVYFKLGEAFINGGKLDSALYYLEDARRIGPGRASVHSLMGLAYLQGGLLQNAKAQLDTALQMDPEDPEAHRFMGLYYTQVDSVDLAIEQYKKTIEIVPGHIEAHNNIAFLYAAQQKYDRAIEYYKRTKELVDNPAVVHDINLKIEAIRAMMDGKMRARFILVKAKSEIGEVLERLQKGEDFAHLAAEYSIAPNAQDGGDVGFFGQGELMPEFEAAVLQLKVGETSGIVRLPMGFMIIQRLN